MLVMIMAVEDSHSWWLVSHFKPAFALREFPLLWLSCKQSVGQAAPAPAHDASAKRSTCLLPLFLLDHDALKPKLIFYECLQTVVKCTPSPTLSMFKLSASFSWLTVFTCLALRPTEANDRKAHWEGSFFFFLSAGLCNHVLLNLTWEHRGRWKQTYDRPAASSQYCLYSSHSMQSKHKRQVHLT